MVLGRPKSTSNTKIHHEPGACVRRCTRDRPIPTHGTAILEASVVAFAAASRGRAYSHQTTLRFGVVVSESKASDYKSIQGCNVVRQRDTHQRGDSGATSVALTVSLKKGRSC